MLIGGGTLGVVYGLGQDDGGYVHLETAHVQTETATVTEGTLDVIVDPGTPDWLVDHLATDVRVDVTGAEGTDVFIGVAKTTDVATYLAGTARDEMVSTDRGKTDYRRITGTSPALARPGDQPIWVTSATGSGPLQLDWKVTSGSWTIVLMNADATPGVAATVSPSVRSDALAPVTIGLLVAGLVDLAGAIALITFGLRRRGRHAGPVETVRPNERDLHDVTR